MPAERLFKLFVVAPLCCHKYEYGGVPPIGVTVAAPSLELAQLAGDTLTVSPVGPPLVLTPKFNDLLPVSYTHLTLPTIYSV